MTRALIALFIVACVAAVAMGQSAKPRNMRDVGVAIERLQDQIDALRQSVEQDVQALGSRLDAIEAAPSPEGAARASGGHVTALWGYYVPRNGREEYDVVYRAWSNGLVERGELRFKKWSWTTIEEQAVQRTGRDSNPR